MGNGCAGVDGMDRSVAIPRQRALTAGAVAVVAAVGLCAGCGQSAKESPSSTTATTSAPAPSPVEKGVIQMPPRAFNQNQNAADGMLALQSQGYNVQLNFSAGSGTDRALSECTITSVDGLRGDHPPANTTVFLTVSCPGSN
ncbi:hypothetical protein [Mycobacterium sp. shizuoka-1]|uniref:hypothetical protein n=1 Tax=Mycobacterium sp. shizuoka-1 TaxID=2039281 RepID=UPI000C0641A6|nr:hypothetical protein [Mycobacterium sp. shizuoka-1]GAY18104.1 hypothetical protein MSZK_48300 [Mycobacterium sp. shizuoka-1]